MKTKSLQIVAFLILTITLLVTGNLQGQTLKANNDTLDLIPGIPATINILANDIIPSGDSVRIIGGVPSSGGITRISVSGGTMTFIVQHWGSGFDTISKYRLMDVTSGDTSSAKIFFRVHDHSFDSLYLNNINARFNACGMHFFGRESAKFEVPKFSGKSTIFLNSLWIGGLDSDSVLHLAAQRYGQGPTTSPAWTKFDFWAGPVMDSSAYSIYTDTVWNYIWNLKKSEIDYHKLHWNQSGYTPIHDILTWPGNGNVSIGQAAILAPFFDKNGDGIYNPHDGDYPLIRGDQALFFIFNDDRDIHTETEGKKMRAEIHGMAYAFDCPEDSALNNTIFLYYKIYNRSARTYYNTYLGVFTDLDIGYAADDYIECDVERGSYIGYNGLPVDGNGQAGTYGENPPAQSVTILGGPYLDPDGIDNPRVDENGHQLCNASVNGVNFGDSIVDNERYGMGKFVYFNNSDGGVPSYMQDPNYALDYYKLMQGIWKDGTRMVYGGNGHLAYGGYGPECNFMFPGESDSLNWGVGTGCQPPNGPVNWTEETAANNPGDRRGVGSMGPFTFLPNSVQDIDISFTFARDYGSKDPQSSLAKLKSTVDIVKQSFVSNTLPNGTSFNGIKDKGNSSSWTVQMYPNPASTFVKLLFNKSNQESFTIRVINSNGSLVRIFETTPRAEFIELNLTDLPQGLYLVNFQSKTQYITKKLSIIR